VSLPQAVNWAKTQAYTSIRSTGEGVNVNLAGREAHGIVDPHDFPQVRDEVAKRLAGFRDPRTGEAPVESVTLREQVLKGKYEDEAPDLLLTPRDLYMLTHARHAVEPADWSSGDHRIEGVLAAAGPSVDAAALPDAVHLIDLAPTILAAAEAPASIRATGRVLHELVGHGAVEAAEGAVDLGESGAEGLEESEVDEIEDHLRGLGYLE
jgi:predicted AlkP superfamily phosphohydrolase/phosphomutase